MLFGFEVELLDSVTCLMFVWGTLIVCVRNTECLCGNTDCVGKRCPLRLLILEVAGMHNAGTILNGQSP